VPTSKEEGREWEKERKGMARGKGGRGGEGGKGQLDPCPGLRKCKGGNPKVWGSANYA